MNPIPISSIERATRSGARSIFAPSASSTSADPQRELTERLPCFATRTPAPAITNEAAVEILNVPAASPPVPAVSTRHFVFRSAPGRKNRRRVASHRLREADHLVNRLAFNRSAVSKPAISASLAAPRKNIFHCGFGFGARQIFDRLDFFKGFEDHENLRRKATRLRAVIAAFLAGWFHFEEPHRSLLVLDVPSKLSSFCEHKILALFKASFRKPMEQE